MAKPLAQSLLLNERFLQIASKTPLTRLTSENDYLYFHFLTFPFFANIIEANKLGDLMYHSLIRVMNFRQIPPGSPIYRVGEMNTSMFILLECKANVYKTPKHYEKKKNKASQAMFSLKAGLSTLLSSQIDKKIDYQLNTGDTYGISELKVLKKRQCLVEAKTYCIIAEISKLDYIMIFEKTNFLEKLNTLNFLYHVKVFQACNNNVIIENLYDSIHKYKLKKGDVVMNQGDVFKNMYVIAKGTFQIIFHSTRKMINKFIHGAFDTISPGQDEERFTNLRKFELLDEYEDMIEYKLVQYEKGEIIGDIEYKYEKDHCLFSVICDLDDSVILEFSVKTFNLTVPEKFKNKFLEEIEWKIDYFKKRFEDIKVVNKANPKYQNVFKKEILTKLTKNPKLSQETDNEFNYFTKVSNSRLATNTKKIVHQMTTRNYHNTATIDRSDKTIYEPNYTSLDNTDNVQTNYLNDGSLSSQRYKQKRPLQSAYPFIKNKREFIPILTYNSKITENSTAPVSTMNTKRKIFLKTTENFHKEINKTNILINVHNSTPTNTIPQNKMKEKDKNSSRILFTKNKKDFAQCFEINKGFFLKNNTSILNKQLTNIFVGNSK